MTEDTANILDVAMGAFAKYNAHLDYSAGDVVLKLVPTSPEAPGVGSRAGVQQPIQHILDSISTTIDSTKQTQLISFLDLLLVKTNDFLSKYFDWLEKLAGLNARVLELENIRAKGMTMRLHEGFIIHSALADTENKIKEQFGGYRWKRIMNFPLLVNNSKRNEVGQRGGESFVSLMRKHIPNHRHGMDINSTSGGDTWKDNMSGTHPFLSGQTPGLNWGNKTVYPEIAALNWNQDNDRTNLGSMTGAERYVKPHFNIPPYKDVYIWECTQVNKSVQPMTYTPSVAKIVDAPMGLPGSVSFASVLSPRETTEDEDNEDSEHRFENILVLPTNIQNNIKSKNPLVCLTALQGWETFMSDALAAESNLRYDSKDAPLPDLADLVDWHIWCETLHIEQRYLFKDAFAYLLEDIQDRIYLLMERLSNALNGINNIPQRVFKGQYIFLKGTPSGMSEQQVLAHYYKLPEGLSFVKVSNVFLRGTPMFTEESKSMFNEYATMLDSAEMTDNLGRLTTSGGLSNVNLYAENFPKHLHWSTLLSGLNSANVSSAPGQPTGGIGSDMMMNDPRSGGFKYGTSNGTGPYKVEVKDYGAGSAIAHNNMPKYITMSVYLVS